MEDKNLVLQSLSAPSDISSYLQRLRIAQNRVRHGQAR
jgi:hypothetical protein